VDPKSVGLSHCQQPADLGSWNMLWIALGPGRRLQIGWHGVFLSCVMLGGGAVLAAGLGLFVVTPLSVLAVMPPLGFAYYVIWRYGVAFLNALVGLDE
jgi:hypothetical protein